MDSRLSEKAVRDVAGLFGAQLAVQFMAVFLSAWLVRKVPADDLSLWPLALGLAAALGGLSSMGLADYFVRTVPKLVASGEEGRAAAELRAGLLLNLLSAAVLAGLAYAYADQVGELLLRKPGQGEAVRLLLVPAILLALGDHLQWAMRSLDMIGGIAALNLASGVARLPAMVALFLVAGTKGMVAGIAVSAAVRVVAPLVFLRRWLWGRGLAPMGRLMLEAAPFYGAAIAALGTGRARYLVIGAAGAPEVLASYFVGERVAELLDGLSAAGTSTVAPKLAMKAGAGPDQFKQAFEKATRFFYWAFVPVCMLVVVYAKPLMLLYGGRDYAGDWGILAILAGSYLVRVPYGLLYQGIKVCGKPLLLPTANLAVSIATVGLMAVGVMVAGGFGAASSVVVAHILGVALAYVLLTRCVGPLNMGDGLSVGVPIAVVGALLGCAVALPTGHVSQPLVLGAATALFVGAYLALVRHRLTRDETGALWGLVPARLRGWRWIGGLHRASVGFLTGEHQPRE